MSGETTVLVLGASGMLGNAVLRFFAASPGYAVVGTGRSASSLNLIPHALRGRIISGVDAGNDEQLAELFARARPDVVVNCVGLVKQLAEASDPLAAIPINSLLPHRLVRLCSRSDARLIHVSTDCVFSGAKGNYRESDVPDASDMYGRSKLLGEVDDKVAVTLRTSIIGPELGQPHGLLGWVISQRGRVKGFTRAIFSGLPTVELARVMRDFVLPNPDIQGVYHVAAEPISKHDLLSLIARVYDLPIEIEPDGALAIDRSLDATRFRALSGYAAPAWPELVRAMRDFG
jgi:dTDP-4-dehydrorhamnose reductase